MSDYQFETQEPLWQAHWKAQAIYKSSEDKTKPKFYVLDMFPYPSGAGLHVGHPLGYIASDIVARFKRMHGFNVLHPMGFDAFGLPAEQYAIQTGQHPALTTETNIKRYKEQLDKIGFSFDWSREVQTSNPDYYRWTQWIFIQLFESWFDKTTDQARPISALIAHFNQHGNQQLQAAGGEEAAAFSATEWAAGSATEQAEMLMQYRLAYLAEARVNWCPALGTVLANDEVKDGVSERGGYPVEIRMMKQWMMRIGAYAQRLLSGLNDIDWSDAIKEQQRNWIGRSEGASIRFQLQEHSDSIDVFTTRPDTIFGVSFMVLAPEHALVTFLSTEAQREEVDAYISKTKNRSERDRMADVKTVSGVFTGAYALHPFTKTPIPIWIADYVLAGYGTGAVMAVPGGDDRDWRFAKHFALPIIDVIDGSDVEHGANASKDAGLINSSFLNGLAVPQAIRLAIDALEKIGAGKGKVQFRLRDAIFSRQRYWGEPVPIYFENGIPKAIPSEDLPLILPAVDKYLPTQDGEPPLARAENWTYQGHPLETTTMPGWAGSSWYFLRYMDPGNATAFAEPEKTAHWNQVDLYLGGSEHATGHLLYARFWTHFLFDAGYIGFKEPFKKLVNQGMIQGVSAYLRASLSLSVTDDSFVQISSNLTVAENELRRNFKFPVNHKRFYYSAELQLSANEPYVGRSVDISLVNDHILDIKALITSGFDTDDFANAIFICKGGYIYQGDSYSDNGEPSPVELSFNTYSEVEKMSKSKRNVVNPDDIIAQYGADTLRLYEMFLGPLEDSKPWDTKGIEGVHRFLQKLWRLFHENGVLYISEETPSEAELKVLHRTIKKIIDDIERFSFNTCVSAFMICVNELQALKCRKKAVLDPLVRLLSPFAPHITERLWQLLGNDTSVHLSNFPTFEERHLIDDSLDYPIQENGKMRFNLTMPKQAPREELEHLVLSNERVKQLAAGRTLKKIIVVPGRIVNLVY